MIYIYSLNRILCSNKNVCSDYVLTWKTDYDIIFSKKTGFHIVYTI